MKYVILISALVISGCELSDRIEDTNELVPEIAEYALEEELFDIDEVFDQSALSPRTDHSGAAVSALERQLLPKDHDRAPMLVKTGKIRLEVQDIELAKSLTDSIVRASRGYYQSDILHQGSDHSSYELIIKLPVRNFDLVPSSIRQLGEITFKSINVVDVTKEYHDLSLRLKHHEAYLDRYIEILDIADSIKDILTIQERIRVLEEEVEAKKGHMRYLNHQSTYSTLHLTIDQYHPQLATTDNPHFGHDMANAFISGLNGLLDLIISLLSIWPILLMLSGLIWVVFRRTRRRDHLIREQTS